MYYKFLLANLISVGEEDAFTGMLLKPWTASKRTEADVEPEGSDEVHHDPQVAEA